MSIGPVKGPSPRPIDDERVLRLTALGASTPREYSFTTRRGSIGCDLENDLVILAPTVSRRHAIVRRRLGRWTVTDLKSTNGTFVNGRRIGKPTRLRPGDEIGFGAAKFSVVGKRVAPGARLRLAGAAAGIVALCAAGFLGTEYAIKWSRNPGASAPAPAPAPPASEATSAMPESPAADAANETDEGEETNNPDTTAAEPAPPWLKRLNYFRALTGLAALKEDPNLTDGVKNHAVYLFKNYGADFIHGVGLGADAHAEDSSKDWYTPEGAAAAPASNVTYMVERGATVPDPQGWAIDGWMTVPFHRLAILNPRLRRVAFGSECSDALCVAVLNIRSGTQAPTHAAIPLEHPIEFPPDGSTIPSAMRQLETEWPSPVSGCEGYSLPVGIPATLQMGTGVDAELESFSFERADGTALEACGFDADSYRNPVESERANVNAILRQAGAVVIVPREPLEAGASYTVTATVNGHEYRWSFAMERQDP